MATFTNQATLNYSGGTVNSNIISGEVLEVISVTKTAIGDSYENGGDISYAINIFNAGATAVDGLTLTDNLGENTVGTATVRPLDYVDGTLRYFINGVLQPAPTFTSTDNLVVSGISIPADGEATVIYTARANSFASPTSGGTVNNTATVSGAALTIPATATASVAVEEAPNLTITKALSPAVVAENGELTYTFTIQNLGNAPAAATDSAAITDTFNPILSNITVSYNGTPLALGTGYTYNDTTGAFATVPGVITVPAATFTQDTTTGAFVITPGTATVTVTGTV